MTDQMIRPVSDLRNNFADVSRVVHETGRPVFLTKNGFGDMVVLSMEAYEQLRFDSEIYDNFPRLNGRPRRHRCDSA